MNTDVLCGRCRCGAALTVDHIQNHCPLRPQQDAPLSENTLEHTCLQILAQRLDTSHVAVLGEN
jgi:hypothetical protein